MEHVRSDPPHRPRRLGRWLGDPDLHWLVFGTILALGVWATNMLPQDRAPDMEIALRVALAFVLGIGSARALVVVHDARALTPALRLHVAAMNALWFGTFQGLSTNMDTPFGFLISLVFGGAVFGALMAGFLTKGTDKADLWYAPQSVEARGRLEHLAFTLWPLVIAGAALGVWAARGSLYLVVLVIVVLMNATPPYRERAVDAPTTRLSRLVGALRLPVLVGLIALSLFLVSRLGQG